MLTRHSRRITIVFLTLAATGAGGLAIANTLSHPTKVAAPDGPAARATPLAAPRTGTLMLTVQIDAGGVTVQQTTRKPNLEWRAPRRIGDQNLRWVMRDSAGATVAEGGIDAGKLCLDPAHAGQPPHMEGDVAVPHVTHTNLKVPDLPDFDRLEFRIQEAATARAFGTIIRNSLEVR
ncbi:MAG: hypothetical protein AB7I19_05310 [Planctomycetota bacterium]